MSSQQRKAPAAREASRPARVRRRPYRRPQLEEYGSLRELTRSFAFDIPGDEFATSFVN